MYIATTTGTTNNHLTAELLDVQVMAPEFQMAFLPSSVLSESSAAVQLSSSSKTDR